MNKLRALCLAACLAMTACHSAAGDPPLAGARIGGPFTLTDQDGRTVRDTQFAGRYRMVYFGYTYCPDVCPTALQHLMQGLRDFTAAAPDRAAKLQPLFITVDPARDTPAVMKRYAAAFDPRLIGLTGSAAQIAAVAAEFGVYYKRQEQGGGSDYLVDHMSQAYLLGPKGEPITLLPQEQDGKAVAAELDKWVR